MNYGLTGSLTVGLVMAGVIRLSFLQEKTFIATCITLTSCTFDKTG